MTRLIGVTAVAQRKSAADPTKPAVASKTSAAKARAQKENLAKGRAARIKQKEEQAAREAAGEILTTAGERWAKLLDGTMSVQELDEEELSRMQVRSKDGSFAGRPRAVPSHLAQAMQKEAIKRATEMFRQAAPKAVKRLLEIADDPDTKESDAIRALDIVLNRGLGKMPETVLVEEKSKWDEAQEQAFTGIDRTSVDDSS